jgi:hypothetical protein
LTGLKIRLPPRFLFAVGSTAFAAVFFAVVGEPRKFPGEWFGYVGFLVGVFCLALYVYGKLD